MMKDHDYLDIPTWPMEEVSTRNCFHAKIVPVKKKLRVKCDLGFTVTRNPTVAYGNTLALSTVLKESTWACKVCKDCDKFDNEWQ